MAASKTVVDEKEYEWKQKKAVGSQKRRENITAQTVCVYEQQIAHSRAISASLFFNSILLKFKLAFTAIENYYQLHFLTLLLPLLLLLLPSQCCCWFSFIILSFLVSLFFVSIALSVSGLLLLSLHLYVFSHHWLSMHSVVGSFILICYSLQNVRAFSFTCLHFQSFFCSLIPSVRSILRHFFFSLFSFSSFTATRTQCSNAFLFQQWKVVVA